MHECMHVHMVRLPMRQWLVLPVLSAVPLCMSGNCLTMHLLKHTSSAPLEHCMPLNSPPENQHTHIHTCTHRLHRPPAPKRA